jgi:ATP-dependent helicase HrpB
MESRVYFDSIARRVLAEEQVRFRDLVVGSRQTDRPPVAEASRMLAAEVIQKRLTLRNWDDSIEQWILRLNLLSQWCPELGLSPLREEDRHHLIEQMCEGAVSYKEIKDREVKPVVQSWLSGPQRELLEKHAPERFTFPNGRTPKIQYLPEGQPYIEMRIQDLFGIRSKPKIANGKISLVVHILAPNMRPVQITQDLVSFWREQYPKIKRELQRKYPKHEWR